MIVAGLWKSMHTFVHVKLLLGLSCILAVDATFAEQAWDLPNEYPATSVPGETVELFARSLESLSGNSIEISIHHGGALGINSVDHFDAVSYGAVELASSSAALWGGIHPVFQLSSLPFLTQSLGDVGALYNVAKASHERVFRDNNQILLFVTPWPPSGIWSNRPIDNMDSLKGLKIRTYNAFGTLALREVGASPIQLSWVDVIPQLTTGGIDAVLTSAEGGSKAGFAQYLSHFTEINFASPLQIVHMNLDVYNSLTGEQRGWIRQAARESEEDGFRKLSGNIAENYRTMRENGVTIIDRLDPGFMNHLRKAGDPIVSEWKFSMGESGQFILEGYDAYSKQ